jgi:hypothetical protein
MIIMLGVLVLMIQRAGDPNTWSWFVGKSGGAILATQATPQPARAANQPLEKSSQDIQPLAPSPLPTREEARNQADKPPMASGPTDQDAEENDAAREEFEAITDGTLSIQIEEMPSYKRVLRWVENQPAELLQQRARTDLTMTDLFQTPEKYRGQLIRLELNVGLVNKLDGCDSAPLWEIWGWTSQSKGWMYDGIVIDLPKGMPTGEVKDDGVKATLVGYFYKLQGYRPAASKPGAGPERAPLVIGRLAWHPTPVPQVERSDWSWILVALAGFVLLAVLRLGLLLRRHKRRRDVSVPAGTTRSGTASLENWLEQVDTAQHTGGDNQPIFPASSDFKAGYAQNNGHSNGVEHLFPDVLDDNRPHNG